VLTSLQLAVDNHTKVLVRVYPDKVSLSEGVGNRIFFLLLVILRALHLERFTLSCQVSVHLMKADRSVCKSEQSSADVTWQKMTQTSANKRQGESSSVEMPSMYTKKRSVQVDIMKTSFTASCTSWSCLHNASEHQCIFIYNAHSEGNFALILRACLCTTTSKGLL